MTTYTAVTALDPSPGDESGVLRLLRVRPATLVQDDGTHADAVALMWEAEPEDELVTVLSLRCAETLAREVLRVCDQQHGAPERPTGAA